MPDSSTAFDTLTVGVDGSLRLVYQGRYLVLGRHQIQLLHALRQPAEGWLPRASIPAVLAGIPFVPHHPHPLPSRQQAQTIITPGLDRTAIATDPDSLAAARAILAALCRQRTG